MFAFAALPAIFQLIAFVFLPESPRWLCTHNRPTEARLVLEKTYNGNNDWIEYELSEITQSWELERKAKESIEETFVLARVMKTPHVRKALIIGCSLQAFQQLSGINTIMYYLATIIQSAGIHDPRTAVWISVGISAVNFFATFIPMYLVERIGRRLLLFVSMAGVIITLFALGTAFLLIDWNSAPTIASDSILSYEVISQFPRCDNKISCNDCVSNEHCGFCRDNFTAPDGYCLPYTHETPDVSLIGPCSNNQTEKFEWTLNICVSSYTFLPIIVMIFYLASFSIGYGPLAWVLNAEFYPLWARGTCCALSTCANWTFNLIISLTFLSLSQAVSKHGAFYTYCVITCVALAIAYKYIPETKGQEMEQIELLFMSKKKRKQQQATLATALTDMKPAPTDYANSGAHCIATNHM